MSVQDAELISAYVAFVWAVAWGMRAIRNAISINEEGNNHD